MDRPSDRVENRPFPYFTSEADLLKQVKESAAEGLFKSFELFLGKDVRENSVRFEVLLGVYTNAIQFVNFLETSLAVGCVNTEFKDLKRMTDGKIQFKISVPTIAHGDGRRPQKQKQYLVMKSCNRHHIGAEIELSTLDIEILNTVPDTPLDMTEYIGAVKTVTSALQFGIDALERGLVDTVLNVKIRHAPPLFILKTLSDPTYTERGLKKAMKSDMIAMFKRHLVENSFFLDKVESMPRAGQYIVTMLAELMAAVSKETVLKGVTTYTTPSGESISGVFETTDNVMRKLLTVLGQAGTSMVGPAAYAKYIVRGPDLVTAVSYGRAMRSFDQFLSRIVENPAIKTTPEEDLAGISDGHGALPKTNIQTSVVRLGDDNVVIESLQRVYNEAQLPHPLNRRMQYSYFFPVGLHLESPRYTTSATVRGLEGPTIQPTEAWVMNKNNTLLCFNYQNALKTLCHPRVHNPVHCIQALTQQAQQRPNELAAPGAAHGRGGGRRAPDNGQYYGVRRARAQTMNLLAIVENYYAQKNQVAVTDAARKAIMPREDFLHPSNVDLLRLELHPLFDFFEERGEGGSLVPRACHRVHVGNIPAPLAPNTFHECRGQQFDAATGLSHIIDQATLDIIQETAFDPAYPLLCYVVEFMIHGQEDKFIINAALVALIIESYWNTSGHLAFANSFHMIRLICQHMGNGPIPKEAYAHYRKIYGELIAIEHALQRLAGTDVVGQAHVGEYTTSLLDNNLLPPFAFNDVFTRLLNESARNPEVHIGPHQFKYPGDADRYLVVRGRMEDLVNDAVEIYRDRVTGDHDHNYRLYLGPANDEEKLLNLEKIFYYALLPVCTNGHACGMGADFQNIALMLTYNGPVFADVYAGGDPILAHLENGTLRDLLLASEISPTVDMIRNLCTSFVTCPVMTQSARVVVEHDVTQRLAATEEAKTVEHTVLVNGVAAFALTERARDIAESLFFPVPFHQLYCDPRVAATLSHTVANFVTRFPSQRAGESFNVPPELMAEYREWHKSPMLHYVATSAPSVTSLSAAVAMHNKLSPISFICQAKHKIHPGVALTVVRTDEVLSENIMYSSRASTSVFVGQPIVSRKEMRADAVTFEIDHELATLDMGLGYSSIITPVRVAAITTDMGIHCQDFFSVFPTEQFPNREVSEYIRHKAGADRLNHAPRDPRTYISGTLTSTGPPGLCHGQLSTCEIIPTPVTADVTFFQTSNSPRGRASCVVSCETFAPELGEKFIYDHSISDPAYEFRSTVNPWASQIGSLGDVLYNSTYRQVATPGLYSPCRQFFNKEEMMRNNRGLYTLVTEYAQRIGKAPATGGTDLQYVVINGTDVFLEQPCLFLQEAFPTLSASHRALIDEFMSSKTNHAPVHIGQYLIEEHAPVKRLFKIGNKIAY
ncbi:major capsid protein [Common bottlenose dolphin gammaherpesvirus 1 strain Sarasota]|uniref:Major capsid protein n=1 Tax=Common bottlenose dolphin gammaherpesvirus 1 strain Sarasota TaxID=2022783 RepID=A0A1Z1NEA0_9GAMA|nr:major capsid protein [Common bottlenose dolphin gammaherpesvirus 1 strain Sarasota]ARW78088.1 major capsid protein [Common bottlenose dolphin gammaherpesvirus 1 strain Sarasota]